jgi:hypothetical protein
MAASWRGNQWRNRKQWRNGVKMAAMVKEISMAKRQAGSESVKAKAINGGWRKWLAWHGNQRNINMAIISK